MAAYFGYTIEPCIAGNSHIGNANFFKQLAGSGILNKKVCEPSKYISAKAAIKPKKSLGWTENTGNADERNLF